MNIEADRKAGRFPPRRCEMPDLHEVSGQWAFTFSENNIFVKDGPLRNPQAHAYAANFARLLDKTVCEYQYARAAVEKSAATRPSKSECVRFVHSRGSLRLLFHRESLDCGGDLGRIVQPGQLV